MGTQRVAVIAGDGIGPEIMESAIAVIEATGFKPEWVYVEGGLNAVEKGLPAMPDASIATIREIGIALKSPMTTPKGTGHTSATVAMRKGLDLFANVRPAKMLAGVETPFSDRGVDLIVVRENTEDLYAGHEFMATPDVAQSIKVITRHGSSRLFKYTFEMARRLGRKRVTVVHKANIMKMSDGMFMDEFYKCAKDYPEFQADDIIVDNCCMQLVTKPEQFDILVTENLYGDIISDLCAGLVGGLGLAPGANIGEKYAVFEAVHGSAPDIAGKGIANPTALLMSGVMMLNHIGETEKAAKLLNAIQQVYIDGSVKTRDLGGTATTKELAAAIISRL